MPTAIKRLFLLLTFSFGAIGVVVCLAGIIAACVIGLRLNRATGDVFVQIDTSLLTVRDRVEFARKRVRAAKITSEEIEQSLKNRTKSEAIDRLTSRLGVEEKAERLSSGLQQSDQGLEFAAAAVQFVQQALKLAYAAGVPIETDPTEKLLEELRSLRKQVAEATATVDRIRERTSEAGDEKLLKTRIEQAIQLALRVVATLGAIDSHLGEFENKLMETRNDLEVVKGKVLHWILIAVVGIDFLLIWMAAGQVALCVLTRQFKTSNGITPT